MKNSGWVCLISERGRKECSSAKTPSVTAGSQWYSSKWINQGAHYEQAVHQQGVAARRNGSGDGFGSWEADRRGDGLG